MTPISDLQRALEDEVFSGWFEELEQTLAVAKDNYTHGEAEKWQAMINTLPDIHAEEVNYIDSVSLSSSTSISEEQILHITQQLMLLHPWRKGPFYLDSLHIDTEWRSDWKWDRIAPHLSDMSQQTILDVGCGNGYHLYRMAGLGARNAIGIDPSQKFHAQFLAINHFFKANNLWHLPLSLEELPVIKGFDKVFSMGVLYHRRSPIDHIRQLKNFVRKGGELILETLVIEGDEHTALVPEGRYAQMRNVWFLPSTSALERWLSRCNLKEIRLVDLNQTSIEEQRSTEWMTFHSLKNYLDPIDPNLTIEGYPAPLRATFIAKVID